LLAIPRLTIPIPMLTTRFVAYTDPSVRSGPR
jgi:hypothetical protein